MAAPKFRSDLLRSLVKAAEEQGVMELDHRGRHKAMVCMTCGHREIVSETGRLIGHEAKDKISRFRKHGLSWKGQGGKHA
jgi:hypothetical protein